MRAARLSPIRLIYDVEPTPSRWELADDENMPESPLHDDILFLLQLVLRAWVARTGRDARVGSNVALRWDRRNPKVGVDPDIYLVEPPPPGGDAERSLRLWQRGHCPPQLAIEVVSDATASKDYLEGPEKYAASGVGELWVFDPLRLGPAMHGGPHVLQGWRRDARGRFRRVYVGEGPGFSRFLRAWFVVTDGGRRLRVANDAFGRQLWPTEAEAERAAHEAERAAHEAERAAHEAERTARVRAEGEVAKLRAQLAGRRRRS